MVHSGKDAEMAGNVIDRLYTDVRFEFAGLQEPHVIAAQQSAVAMRRQRAALLPPQPPSCLRPAERPPWAPVKMRPVAGFSSKGCPIKVPLPRPPAPKGLPAPITAAEAKWAVKQGRQQHGAQVCPATLVYIVLPATV